MQKLRKITKLKATQSDPYVQRMLENIVEGKKVLNLRKGIKLFSQGAEANALYFIQSGRVKLTTASDQGKEAVLAMPGPRDFFGEGCLVGQSLRISTATTTESSTIFEIQKRAMLQALHDQPELSEKFVASLLVRHIDMEEGICNQLFNQTEKTLARILLKLSRYGQQDFLPDANLSQLSNETLANLVGTTPARILHFLTKFRKLGLVHYHYNGRIVVRAEMLADIVLHGRSSTATRTATGKVHADKQQEAR
jgi:CRP/FNR family transcriptional regulator, cyclic AMP receptor protein